MHIPLIFTGEVGVDLRKGRLRLQFKIEGKLYKRNKKGSGYVTKNENGDCERIYIVVYEQEIKVVFDQWTTPTVY